VLIRAVEGAARERGWAVVSEEDTSGILVRLACVRLPALLSEHVSGPAGASLLNQAQVLREKAIPFRSELCPPVELCSQMCALIIDSCSLLAEGGLPGLLITVDDLCSHSHDEMQRDMAWVCRAVEDVLAQGLSLSFVGAGLSREVSSQMRHRARAFFKAARHHTLHRLSPQDADCALRGPLDLCGLRIEAEALDDASASTEGWPFLVQRLGQRIWERCHETMAITPEDVAAASEGLGEGLDPGIQEAAFWSCSYGDRAFLAGLCYDGQPSSRKDLARRMPRGKGSLHTYVKRLLATDLVEEDARSGLLRVTLPGLRERILEDEGLSALMRRMRKSVAGAEARERSRPSSSS
jgi:hypothetical protein